MVSPLRRQRDAILRRQSKASLTSVVAPGAATAADSLHLRLIEFEQDKLKLKEFNQIAEKVNHKRDVLIPKYKPVVEAYLEAGESYQNPIFSDVIIWLFDIEELDTATEWLFKAIELKLPTPESFKRDWPTVCADEVLAWSERQLESGNSVEPYFSKVFEKIDKQWQINEKIEAKWYKFAGYALLMNEKGEPQPSQLGNVEKLEKAKALLLKAHEKHIKIGVKTKIDQIDMRIRAIQEGKL